MAASRFSRGGVTVHTRSLLSPFRPAVTLAAADPDEPDPEFGTYGLTLPQRPAAWGYGGAQLRAALTGDGRALLSWSGPRPGADVRDFNAHLATVPLDGSPPATVVADSGVIDPSIVNALQLTDGTPAVNWVDMTGPLPFRLRLAAEGVGGDGGAAPPDVRVERPAGRRLRAAGTLVLPVTCAGPCEVRAQVAGRFGVGDTLVLPKAGKARLRLRPGDDPIAPPRLGPVRVRLTYAAVDGRRTRTETLTLRLVRGPLRRAPRPVGVRAVRVGDALQVSWTMDRPALEDTLIRVLGARSRDSFDAPLTGDIVEAEGRERTFRRALPPGPGVRWVAVQVYTPFATGNVVRYVRVR